MTTGMTGAERTPAWIYESCATIPRLFTRTYTSVPRDCAYAKRYLVLFAFGKRAYIQGPLAYLRNIRGKERRDVRAVVYAPTVPTLLSTPRWRTKTPFERVKYVRDGTASRDNSELCLSSSLAGRRFHLARFAPFVNLARDSRDTSPFFHDSSAFVDALCRTA